MNLLTVYVDADVNLHPMYRPLFEKLTFGEKLAWEITSVEKMEWDNDEKVMVLFFVLNGKVEELRLHLSYPSDILAVYTR